MTEKVFHVGRYTTEGPVWWFKFLNASIPLIGGATWEERLADTLKSYNAIYISQIDSRPTLIFDSERDAMMFILKWS